MCCLYPQATLSTWNKWPLLFLTHSVNVNAATTTVAVVPVLTYAKSSVLLQIAVATNCKNSARLHKAISTEATDERSEAGTRVCISCETARSNVHSPRRERAMKEKKAMVWKAEGIMGRNSPSGLARRIKRRTVAGTLMRRNHEITFFFTMEGCYSYQIAGFEPYTPESCAYDPATIIAGDLFGNDVSFLRRCKFSVMLIFTLGRLSHVGNTKWHGDGG